MTTASMISAASTALGRSENSGARNSSVSRTIAPGDQGSEPGARAGVVVERAGRQAGRHGHPLEQSRPGVGDRLGQRLLVDVDLVAVLGGERAGIAGGLGEADQHQRDGRDRHDRRRGPTSARRPGPANDGSPAGRRRPARPRARRGRGATTPSGHPRPGPEPPVRGGRRRAARRRRPGRGCRRPRSTRRTSPRVPSQDQSSCQELSPLDVGARQLGQLADRPRRWRRRRGIR